MLYSADEYYPDEVTSPEVDIAEPWEEPEDDYVVEDDEDSTEYDT